MYKPPLKIPPEASAVHHITNKMVENKKSFKDSPDFEKIKILLKMKILLWLRIMQYLICL